MRGWALPERLAGPRCEAAQARPAQPGLQVVAPAQAMAAALRTEDAAGELAGVMARKSMLSKS